MKQGIELDIAVTAAARAISKILAQLESEAGRVVGGIDVLTTRYQNFGEGRVEMRTVKIELGPEPGKWS